MRFFENAGALAIESGGAATTRSLTLIAESPVNGMRPVIQNAPDGGAVGITKLGPGGWELFGNNSYSGITRIVEGTLNINGTQTGLGDSIVGLAGTLGGTGTVGGNVIVDGTISPGRSVGTLHIAGGLLLNELSTTVIEISNAMPGGVDLLEIAGSAHLAGNLRVEIAAALGGGYVPKLGDVFPFLSAAGGASGIFRNFSLPTLSPGLEWQINPGSNSLSLSVVAVPEPNCLALLAFAAAGLACTRRR